MSYKALLVCMGCALKKPPTDTDEFDKAAEPEPEMASMSDESEDDLPQKPTRMRTVEIKVHEAAEQAWEKIKIGRKRRPSQGSRTSRNSKSSKSSKTSKSSTSRRSNKRAIVDEIQQVLAEFLRTEEEYAKVRDLMSQEMTKGLSKDGNKMASVKMHITQVRALPNGTENGSYLSLHLGTDAVQIYNVTLGLRKQAQIDDKKIYRLPPNIKTGKGVEDTLASGVLIKWTKEISYPGVVGQDVVQMLQKAFDQSQEIKAKIKVVSVINDTTGCLAYSSFGDSMTVIGAILDEGSNASYLEDIGNVELWTDKFDPPAKVAINTEWGSFGQYNCLDFIRTSFDKEIDRLSDTPLTHLFEKLTSATYLGPIVGQLIVHFTKKGYFFKGKLPVEMTNDGMLFPTKYLGLIERDVMGQFSYTRKVLEDLGFDEITDFECEQIYILAHIVMARAASLVAAGFASLLTRIGRPYMTIGVDGCIFHDLPYFVKKMVTMTKKLAPHYNVKFSLLEDGCGIGAALIAAAELRRLRASKRKSLSNLAKK